MKIKQGDSKILLALLALPGSLVLNSLQTLYDIRRWRWKAVYGGSAYIRDLQRFNNKEHVRQAYRSLKRSGYLSERRVGRRLIITLTDKGKTSILYQQLLTSPALPAGQFTVVIFDIPESQRLSRRHFRWLLRQGGFVKLQQSVWVSQLDVYERMADFIHRMKLGRWVNVYYGSRFLQLPQIRRTS